MKGYDEDLNLGNIAIIGMAGRFPGANTIEEFWDKIKNGVECISYFTNEELEISENEKNDLINNPDFVKAHGILEGIDLFDASFFEYSPREAQIMNPQHRLFLECAYEVLEKTGYNPDRYQERIGVYAGESTNEYIFNLLMNREISETTNRRQIFIGNEKDFLATQVSYKLNLTGPSITIQTACSTSLVAIILACQALNDYKCDLMLTGGVAINIPQKSGYLYNDGDINSPDGHCRPFDENARGTVGGNGVGIVALKRLNDALRDGDHIHAIIKGTGLNNDGSNKVGFTAPSINGESDAIGEAVSFAEIDPATIKYIETHGTGTVLGDPIEIAALTNIYKADANNEKYCAIGSLKANMGHLDSAAGVAGLIKTALVLENKIIPPSINFKSPNPNINFDNSPFYINLDLKKWEKGDTPRRAAVSSFGMGGTNSHAVLEEAPERRNSDNGRPYQLLVLSAKTKTALEKIAKNLSEYLKSNSINIEDVAYTLQVGRREYSQRNFIICKNTEDAILQLETSISPHKINAVSKDIKKDIVFMFPGQGAQYVNMGIDLYNNEKVFKEQVDICSEYLKAYLEMDIRQIIYPNETDTERISKLLNSTDIAQPVIFTVEYALAKMLLAWGIQPSALIGHSIGEYVAACLSGIFGLKDALWLVAQRGKLMQSLPQGAMLAINLGEKELYEYLNNDISIAALNTPQLTVVSGTNEAIDGLYDRLDGLGIDCKKLQTSHAFHSFMMEPILEEYHGLFSKITLGKMNIPFISNLTGAWIKPEEATNPEYWKNHLRREVRFSEGIQKLLKNENRVFLEIGPGQTLNGLVKEHVSNNEVFSTMRHPKRSDNDLMFILNILGQLWLSGTKIDWDAFHKGYIRNRVALPTYPFEKQSYWVYPDRDRQYLTNRYEGKHNEIIRDENTNCESIFQQTDVQYERPNLDNTYVAPIDNIDEYIASEWKNLLNIKEIGISDNFLELGGNSLIAIKFLTRIRPNLKINITLQEFFINPTIAAIADLVRSKVEVDQELDAIINEIEGLKDEEVIKIIT